LNDEKVLAGFQVELAKHRDNIGKDNTKLSVNEKFTQLADYMREYGKEYFEKDQSCQNNIKQWFTPQIMDIVERKAKAYVHWQRHHVMVEENKYRNHY